LVGKFHKMLSIEENWCFSVNCVLCQQQNEILSTLKNPLQPSHVRTP